MSLDQYKFKKGKFIAPGNATDLKLRKTQWFRERMPEYLWMGLIIEKFGRKEGLNKCIQIINCLKNYNLNSPCFSEALNTDAEIQKVIWSKIINIVGKNVLSPLTTVITYSSYPIFASSFCNINLSFNKKAQKILIVLEKNYDNQSNFSTDIRFLINIFYITVGKLHLPPQLMEKFIKYPEIPHEDELMRSIQPSIRAIELTNSTERSYEDKEFIEKFWKVVSTMTECELRYLKYPKEAGDAEAYLESIKVIMSYYTNLYATIKPLDDKMFVLLGMATYSYKRVIELIKHDLYNQISGRSIVRVLIENYIMMKYLLEHETQKDNIWRDYIDYGLGQYGLIAKRYIDTSEKEVFLNSHVPYDYVDMLSQEYINEAFLDMDTKYFDKKGVRDKARDVGEKDLFSFYYDYDSAFEHGLWGAVRESSLIKCCNAMHQYHCVPDINDNQNLKSVWHDCKMVMDKTLVQLKKIYGLPEQYHLNEVNE